MSELNYSELRKQIGRQKRIRIDNPELAAERHKERTRRCAIAQGRATGALTRAFQSEYRALYEAAKAEVWAECGPLPGDEQ